MNIQDFVGKIGYVVGVILGLCAVSVILAVSISITIKFITWLF